MGAEGEWCEVLHWVRQSFEPKHWLLDSGIGDLAPLSLQVTGVEVERSPIKPSFVDLGQLSQLDLDIDLDLDTLSQTGTVDRGTRGPTVYVL
jgi:hypothetical protein